MSANTNIMYEYGAQKFWKWFKDNEEWINSQAAVGDSKVVKTIDKQLIKAFPNVKGEFIFLLGFNRGVGEFFFQHLGRKEFIRVGRTLKKLMPPEVAKRWKFFHSFL